MSGYIIRRLLAIVPVLLLVTFISFTVMEFVPGDPALIVAGAYASQERIQEIRVLMGLDAPFHVRLTRWYADLAQGDMGQSIFLGRSVTEAIWERLPVSGSIALYALLLTILVGSGAGILASLHPNSLTDQTLMSFAMLGIALPNFWLGIMMIILFSVHLGWMPTAGYVPLTEDPLGWLAPSTMPAFSLALMQMGLLARVTRSTMLEVLGQDFIRTAWSKGLSERQVIWRHVLRNVMIPVITLIGIIFSLLMSGAVVIESVFSIPGIGRLVTQAILQRDYPVIQGGVLATALIMIVINFLIDITFSTIDPRVRYD